MYYIRKTHGAHGTLWSVHLGALAGHSGCKSVCYLSGLQPTTSYAKSTGKSNEQLGGRLLSMPIDKVCEKYNGKSAEKQESPHKPIYLGHKSPLHRHVDRRQLGCGLSLSFSSSLPSSTRSQLNRCAGQNARRWDQQNVPPGDRSKVGTTTSSPASSW